VKDLHRKREIFKTRIVVCVAQGFHATTMENLMTRAEVARYLGVSIMTVKRRETAGLLNPIRVGNGRIIRFRKEELDSLLGENGLKRKEAANAPA